MIKLKDILLEQAGKFEDGPALTASQQFWDDIKRDEGLAGSNGEPALKAYKLGDGRITIGWGHTGAMSGTAPKLGDTITKQQAQTFLEADAKSAADCVRRLLAKWKGEGNDAYMVTQGMFDALVSIVFNAGCNGLRVSKFIQHVKKRDYETAAKVLPTDTTMIRGKFSYGLTARRKREAERFLDGLFVSPYIKPNSPEDRMTIANFKSNK